MESADVHALSTAAVHAMSSAQFAALTTADVATLTTAHIGAMTTDQLSALNSADIAALTTAQVAAFNTSHIAALTTDQITHLNTADINAFTTSEMHALTTAQIVSFTTDQIAGFSTHDLASLSSTQAQAFTSTEIGAMSNAQVDALVSASPIVLDLNGDGVHTSAASHGVNFDLAGTGHSSKMGWTDGTDGLLAIDLNHDGRINDGTELFGVGTRLADGTRAGNGYAAMAQYDSNHDGKLTAADAHFKDLAVWVDANHDGKSEAGELKTLGDLGITSLDLHGLAGTAADHGNILGLTSSYTTADGASHQMADVWFTKDTAAAAPTETANAPGLHELLAAPATDLLPGHAADTPTVADAGHATAAAHAHDASVHALHGLTNNRLLDDEQNRANPLI
jgi:trimeric autotransporter adhesin